MFQFTNKVIKYRFIALLRTIEQQNGRPEGKQKTPTGRTCRGFGIKYVKRAVWRVSGTKIGNLSEHNPKPRKTGPNRPNLARFEVYPVEVLQGYGAFVPTYQFPTVRPRLDCRAFRVPEVVEIPRPRCNPPDKLAVFLRKIEFLTGQPRQGTNEIEETAAVVQVMPTQRYALFNRPPVVVIRQQGERNKPRSVRYGRNTCVVRSPRPFKQGLLADLWHEQTRLFEIPHGQRYELFQHHTAAVFGPQS